MVRTYFIMAQLQWQYDAEARAARRRHLARRSGSSIVFRRGRSVQDAKILVLDEATASIDSYTEQQIQKALAVLLKGRTGLVIAHRLATIRGADRILVLQNGALIEQGNHDHLMKLGGLLTRLYNMNYSSFDDIPIELIPQGASVGMAT